VPLYTSYLLSELHDPLPLEASKRLLTLAIRSQSGKYKSPDGKSPYHLLEDWIKTCEEYPQVGEDDEPEDEEEAQEEGAKEGEKSDAKGLMRLGKMIPTAALKGVMKDGKITQSIEKAEEEAALPPYLDPLSPDLLPVTHLLRKHGLKVFVDQSGPLYSSLALYWIKKGDFDRAKAIFEEGLKSVMTVRDFSKVFESYAAFLEEWVQSLVEDEDEDEQDEDAVESRMKDFEDLVDRRPFLVNEVLLRRNPHDVQEWEKRIALHGTNDEAVAETYQIAIESINPKKATQNLNMLFINFAKFYEEGGVAGEAEKDIESARKVFEKGTQVSVEHMIMQDL
jgi:pre-mRNA-splicing factor SYF1